MNFEILKQTEAHGTFIFDFIKFLHYGDSLTI